jgi:hypothetical protein
MVVEGTVVVAPSNGVVVAGNGRVVVVALRRVDRLVEAILDDDGEHAARLAPMIRIVSNQRFQRNRNG